MAENTKNPAIRFKGYIEAWEQRKLEETLISLQNNTLSRAELSTEQGIALNIHYGDVLIKFGEYLDVKKELLPMIMDSSIVAKYKASLLQNGDVIVADTAEDESAGKCSEIAGLSNEIAISGLHTIPYRPLMKFASGYLGYYMNSNSYHSQLLPLMQGIKVTSISKSAMKNTYICYPKDEDEQGDISAFFRTLDHLTTLHQRKIEKLQNVKKSCLEKMFPKSGGHIPEIRFAGFTEAWEQRKVSDEIDSVDTGKSKFSIKDDGNYEILGSTSVIGYDDEYDYEGDFLLTARVGANAGTLYRHSGKVKITDNTVFLQGHNLDYLFYQLIHFDLHRLSFGTGQPLVKASELKSLQLLMPTEESEKEHIATFFTNLDHLITLHQRKLEKLQNIKKSCLERMFV